MPEDDCAEIKIAMKSDSLLKTFLNTMWNQTIPLFHKKYLRSTLIVCTTQFWIYLIVNGLYMWFPHIINSMSEFMNTHPGENKLLCQIVYDKDEFLYHNDGVSIREFYFIISRIAVFHINFSQWNALTNWRIRHSCIHF